MAKTKPRGEAATAAILTQRDIEVFLPFAPAAQRRGSRTTTREVLFPGYLFVRLGLDSPLWLGARSAPGIAYFLGAGDRPSALPDEMIEGMGWRTDQHPGIRPQPLYERGEAVIIKQGPFAGLEAIFDSTLTARGCVRVLLELVQRLVPVDVDIEQLARAS